ncbi:Peptidase A1 domain-containing protein [Mycena indigotica]|uniref:Peptidase A1 domain-containing protein n=1 Tax=Mycena indigotica TaxID=2126181 RepID=A0A8H6TAZ2_9AGAR|nr:Peptidase A1 domain-containing protein [Mycena indigotica]KAF7315440.1 Peptidase A1 domain-containing protein [Mycena indigotica]
MLTSSTESLRRFCRIEQKSAPTHLFPTYLNHEQGTAGGASVDYKLPDIPSLAGSFVTETEEFWQRLDNLSQLEEATQPTITRIQSHPEIRIRTQSIPSKPFNNLSIVPSPKIDVHSLRSGSRTTRGLTSASLQTLYRRSLSDSAVGSHLTPSSRQLDSITSPQEDTANGQLGSRANEIDSETENLSTAPNNQSLISMSAFPVPATRATTSRMTWPTADSMSSFSSRAGSSSGPSHASLAAIEERRRFSESGILTSSRYDEQPRNPNELQQDLFSQTRLPTERELAEVAELTVISETGVGIPFGSLWRNQRTIVCFIRHFWCPLCQDYMFSISRNVPPEILRSAGVELVIISNGSFEMIKAYRQIFKTAYHVFTDPTHQVYNALGMTLQTLEKGPKSSYVRHGTLSGIGMVVANAVKVGMPVWKAGGEISQLGGEFILGPGLTCSWAHRMKYTRNHAPILKVIEAAGIDMLSHPNRVESPTDSFLGMSEAEEVKWINSRRKMLKNLRNKKLLRRGGAQFLDTSSITTANSSNRSSTLSVGGSLCSWDPVIEEAINIPLENRDMAVIEEVEEEERLASLAKNDSHTDFDLMSEVESSATELESIERSVVKVSFEPDIKAMEENIHLAVSRRSSCSSLGSGYDVVFATHGSLFNVAERKWEFMALSQSSLGSL